jgi:hypothetical protein
VTVKADRVSGFGDDHATEHLIHHRLYGRINRIMGSYILNA